jgi:hypothetical protein
VSALVLGIGITLFDAEDSCIYLARVSGRDLLREGFDAAIESAQNGGVGEGGWACSRYFADEGVTWIRGWYRPTEPEALALRAAGLLARSAA